MTNIQVQDQEFELFLSNEQIQAAVGQMAKEILHDYRFKTPCFVLVLNGSLFFAVDLMQHIPLNCQVASIKCSSYQGQHSTQEMSWDLDFSDAINGQDLIILEDIVDTGFTLTKIAERLKNFEPSSVRYASLFYKPDAMQYTLKPDYIGLVIPNDYVLGYGLDYDGYGRNLKDLYRLVQKQQ
jgi:hypoxanthine phosphoribosyltransferase